MTYIRYRHIRYRHIISYHIIYIILTYIYIYIYIYIEYINRSVNIFWGRGSPGSPEHDMAVLGIQHQKPHLFWVPPLGWYYPIFCYLNHLKSPLNHCLFNQITIESLFLMVKPGHWNTILDAFTMKSPRNMEDLHGFDGRGLRCWTSTNAWRRVVWQMLRDQHPRRSGTGRDGTGKTVTRLVVSEVPEMYWYDSRWYITLRYIKNNDNSMIIIYYNNSKIII